MPVATGNMPVATGTGREDLKVSKFNPVATGALPVATGTPVTGFLGSFVISRILKMRIGLNSEGS
ncbi:hypothetical protein CsatA_019596 [Cannabis sativa]